MNSKENENEKKATDEDDHNDESEEVDTGWRWFRWATQEDCDSQVHAQGSVCAAFAIELMILSCVMLLSCFVGIMFKWCGINYGTWKKRPFLRHKRKPPDKGSVKRIKKKIANFKNKTRGKTFKTEALFRLGLIAALNVVAKTPCFHTRHQINIAAKIKPFRNKRGLLDTKKVQKTLLPELRHLVGMSSTNDFLGEDSMFTVIVDSG